MSAPVRVRTFPPLSRGRLISLSVAAAVMLLSARKEFIAPGSPIYDYLLAGHPRALTNTIRVQNGLFYVLVGVHSVECVLFAFAKLHRHGVPFLSVVWWKWMAMNFVGGASAWSHFDKLVKATASKQE